jgi:hypothetical protein
MQASAMKGAITDIIDIDISELSTDFKNLSKLGSVMFYEILHILPTQSKEVGAQFKHVVIDCQIFIIDN